MVRIAAGVCRDCCVLIEGFMEIGESDGCRVKVFSYASIMNQYVWNDCCIIAITIGA